MERKIEIQNSYALLGKNISYSFSRGYFLDKFQNEAIEYSEYFNIDIPSLEQLPLELKKHPNLRGFNVTIPYKEEIIPFLSEIDPIAQEIKAVNTVKILPNGELKGYNTDYYGFLYSLKPYLKPHHKSALILGSGGASKAITYALQQLNIPYFIVSRTPQKGMLSYQDLTKDVIKSHSIVINCTPLGTYPNIHLCPEIDFSAVGEYHLFYDLVYNPEKTTFIKRAELQGATTCNGLKMLILQAELSWNIWTDNLQNKPNQLP